MSDLNKCILLVMKWLDNKDSVSKDELLENRRSAYTAYAATATATAYATAYATAATGEWLNKYFERTDENKQDYIDAIEAEKKPQEIESKEWDGEGFPPIGCECEVESDIRGVWKKAMYVGVDSIGSHVFDVEKTCLWRIDSIDEFVRPLKTEKEKEREAFVDACFAVSCALHNNANEHAFNDLFDAGFKAPEGE